MKTLNILQIDLKRRPCKTPSFPLQTKLSPKVTKCNQQLSASVCGGQVHWSRAGDQSSDKTPLLLPLDYRTIPEMIVNKNEL